MGKKYKTVYADLPWAYRVYSKKGQGRSAENHYHTMDIEEIRSLPVESIADDDCILFLWVTFRALRKDFLSWRAGDSPIRPALLTG